MNAVLGTLRANFRLRGTVIFWGFYGVAILFAVALQTLTPSVRGDVAITVLLGFAAWMGWLQFLSRLWQLQRHAESLMLPGARRSIERATLLLVALGTTLPAALLALLGAPTDWLLLGQWLALATALLYLLLTPTWSVLLVVAFSVLPMVLGKQLQPLLGDQGIAQLGLWSLTALLLTLGISRWRRTMQSEHQQSWNAPQVISMAERGLAGTHQPNQEPTQLWIGRSDGTISAAAGPRARLLSLSILICGPLAPLGWRNYLGGAAWMLLAIGFLAVLMFIRETDQRGPDYGMAMILGVWSMSVPLTLIVRLRQSWRNQDQGLAEAALLPGITPSGGSWLQLAGVVLYTTGYRLLLPTSLMCLLLGLATASLTAVMALLGLGLWGLLLTCSLLPLARRRSNWAGFLLYVAVGAIMIGLLASMITSTNLIPGLGWTLLLPITITVLVMAVIGWRVPTVGRPLSLP